MIQKKVAPKQAPTITKNGAPQGGDLREGLHDEGLSKEAEAEIKAAEQKRINAAKRIAADMQAKLKKVLSRKEDSCGCF